MCPQRPMQALTLKELHRALQSMECGKAPGLDGIPADVYKVFWPENGSRYTGCTQ